MSLTTLSAAEQLRRLAAGDVSSAELTQAYLDRIGTLDAQIGAFLRVDPERALTAARSVDERRARGEPLGRLAGLPVAIKDILCEQGEQTTCASRMLQEFAAPYDASVIEKLRAADAVPIGRTNMDEFAMGSSTENSAMHPTHNPWDLDRSPGGSSGGGAAAVAADFAPLSVATDTGGSIRQPAALCGVVGLKPTYGRVSRYGLVAFASSFDQIGPIARTVEDAALLLQTLAGHDPRDSTSLDQPVPDYTAACAERPERLRLGVVKEHFGEGLDGEVADAIRAAIAQFESLGAEVVDLSLPHSRYAVATYYVVAPCEASSNLARYDGVHYGHRTTHIEGDQDTALVRMYRRSRAEGFGREVKRRIMLGTYALSAGYYDAYYLQALKVRRLIRQDYDAAFNQVDLIIGPATPGAAFKLGELVGDPLSLYLLDLYTVSANLTGLPALSMPCGFTGSGLPIGVQLQAPPLEEARLLAAGAMYQQATDWHLKRPQLQVTR